MKLQIKIKQNSRVFYKAPETFQENKNYLYSI